VVAFWACVRAASQVDWGTAPWSKSCFTRSASDFASSMLCFAARTSGTWSGSIPFGDAPSCSASLARACATAADAACDWSATLRASSTTSGSPFLTREPTSTATLTTRPPTWVAASLVSSATRVPLMSSVCASGRAVTLPKCTAGFWRGAAVSRAGDGCASASGRRQAVNVGTASAPSSAATTAARE
jgi:hypothetical protein